MASATEFKKEAVIRLRYILDRFYSISGCQFEKVNDHLFLVKDGRSGQQLVFKIHAALRERALGPLTTIYELTSRKGFSPRIVPTKNGAFMGRWGDLVFTLQERLYPEKMKPADEIGLARRLAGLHSLLYSSISDPIRSHFDETVADMRTSASRHGLGCMTPLIDKVEEMAGKLARQTVHGDPHSGNVLFHRGQAFFIDFDSAARSNAIFDVAFAAFRCLNDAYGRMHPFVKAYNDSHPPHHVEASQAWPFLAYEILRRILFILIERDNGVTVWMGDLENQIRLFLTVLEGLDNRFLVAKNFARQILA